VGGVLRIRVTFALRPRLKMMHDEDVVISGQYRQKARLSSSRRAAGRDYDLREMPSISRVNLIKCVERPRPGKGPASRSPGCLPSKLTCTHPSSALLWAFAQGQKTNLPTRRRERGKKG